MDSLDWSKEKRKEAGKRFAKHIAESWKDSAAQALRRRMDVAADLGIAIAESQQTRKEVAERAEMKPALLSRQLSGEVNLTLDSIGRICDAIGYDFDVILRKAIEPAARQPWERQLDRASIYRLMHDTQHKVTSEKVPAVWRSNFTSKSDVYAANHEFEMAKEIAA